MLRSGLDSGAPEARGHDLGMTVANIDASAGGRHGQLQRNDPLTLQTAQDLARLALDLLLFLRDLGDHVVERVQRRDARAAARAG